MEPDCLSSRKDNFSSSKDMPSLLVPVPLAEIACYKIQVECKMQLRKKKKETKSRQTGFPDFSLRK